MRVLIADDDVGTCRLIQKVVQLCGHAETLEAHDGDEALALATENCLDLMLLDWDMPAKTGLEIVKMLRAAGSQVPIIMVTGISERTKVIEAVGAGISDFVVKPFAPQKLRETIQRYWRPEVAVLEKPLETSSAPSRNAPGPLVSALVRSTPDDEQSAGPVKLNLHSILRRIEDISTLPDIAIRAMAVANDPNASAAELQEILEGDPGITARVLRCSNSAAYGARKEITDLQQAITFLGFTQIRQLILTATVSELFKTKGGVNSYRRLSLWQHMVSVAICARLISRKLHFANGDEVFLAGLMHDIGIILEDQYTHQHFCKIIRGLDPDKTLIEVEREHLRFDHTTLGEVVATRWGFPEVVRAAIRYHHSSMLYDEQHKLPVRCVELANMICSRHGITSVGIDLVHSFDPEAGALKLTQADLAELPQELEHELARYQSLLHL